MIFNLFSNIAQSRGELEILQNTYWKKMRLSAPHIYNTEQTTIDPVATLLEDIKNRNIEILIPTKRDIIPNLWNSKKSKKSVDVVVNPTKSNWANKIHTIFELKLRRSETAQQKIILKKLEMVPAYTLVGNRNELLMTMARRPEKSQILTWLIDSLSQIFVIGDSGPTSTAFFFLNKEDACLYMHSLGEGSDIKLLEKSKVHIKKTNLSYFYHINHYSKRGKQARVIANLEELEKVVVSRIPTRATRPHIKQSYSKNGFIGTPIYTINLISTKTMYKQQNIEVTRKDVKKYLHNIFFSLEDAYLAWEKISKTNKNAKLGIRPKIEVYNLENYLLDLEKSPKNIIEEINFIPSSKSNINFERKIKLLPEEEESSGSRIKKYMIRCFRYEKLVTFYKGIVWLFTADSLPTENNAW